MKVTPTPGSVSGRRIDRLGDPLDGLINLFDLALVLAVGLLLAALSSAGAVGLVSGGGTGGTPISGQPNSGQQAEGQGTAVGTVYRLEDGTYVFSPSGSARGATGATSTPGATAGAGSVPQDATPIPAPTPTVGTGGVAPQGAVPPAGGAPGP